MIRVVLTLVLFLAMTLIVSATPGKVNLLTMRKLALHNNLTCILVFGDSSVDPGNNNHLPTTFKGNFEPYGKNFFNGRPTGRFCNGRLPTDFIAEAIGYTKIIPGFLDPHLKKENLLHGVSFASAASGYDDLTANLTNVLPVSKQLAYLKHYKLALRRIVGQAKAEEIINNAIIVMSMGTNDFIQNYYLEPIRSKEFSVQQYTDYLIKCMTRDIKELYAIGGRRLALVGIPPLGCMPLVKTLMGSTTCVKSYNDAVLSFNNKAKAQLAILEKMGVKSVYVDAYGIIQNAIKNPAKYGFTVTAKGCCGSGEIEFGDTCRGMKTCEDPTKYVFWDAVHPTEKMYSIIAENAINSVARKIFV
ncbi:hypothetical protein GIB67_039277 [Kingdonia uniflora]|uniref:GDSL esterase/lipase n=1 Tax=Kingdonia uniflora TaxID=39325 RepID=A0A7J7MM32_9MAGN|nr:hypothetical protein GIB67_039277 [Kingdonia uniflora]